MGASRWSPPILQGELEVLHISLVQFYEKISKILSVKLNICMEERMNVLAMHNGVHGL